jgi:hypothetical protein
MVMESMIVLIVVGVMMVGAWRMGRIRKKRLEMPMPDPAGTPPKVVNWDWDDDSSDDCDFG